MKIIVLIKNTRQDPESSDILTGLDPGDRAALHTALALANQADDITVSALTAGPKEDEAALCTALKAGADRGIRLFDPSLKSGDIRTIAALLAAGIRHLDFDLVIAGNRSSEWGTGALGPAVAHFLGIPHLSSIIAVDREGDVMLLEHRRDGGEVFTCKVPVPLMVMISAGPVTPVAERSDIPEIEMLDMADMTLPFRYADSLQKPMVTQVDAESPRRLDGTEELIQVLKRIGPFK